MKKLSEVNFRNILNKRFEDLSEEEEMLLVLKSSINKIKENSEDAFTAAIIVTTYQKLQGLGWEWSVNKEMDICTLNTVPEEQRKNYTDLDDLYINLD